MPRLLVPVLVGLLLVPAAATAAPLVSYSREGGFTGRPLSLTISEKGRARAVEGFNAPTRRFRLDQGELRKVKRLLRAARFASLDADYRPSPGTVADGYTETVTYGPHEVVTGTGGDAPPRLTRLLGALSELAAAQ